MRDPETTARQLVRHWRGDHTQRQWAETLEVHASTVAHWESGRNGTETTVAFRMAELARPGTLEQLSSWVSSDWTSRVDTASTEGIALLMNDLLRKREPTAVAKAVGVDRSTFARWLRAASQPKLAQFIAFLEAVSLAETVVHLLAPAFSMGDPPYRGLSELGREVALTLKLEAYRQLPRHDLAWVARMAGQTEEQAAAGLAELERLGSIDMGETHWVVRRTPPFSFTLFPPPPRPAERRIHQLLHTGRLHRHHVFVGIFSEQDRERIRKVLFDAAAEIKRIIKQTGHEGDQVGYVSLAMLMLGDQQVDRP